MSWGNSTATGGLRWAHPKSRRLKREFVDLKKLLLRSVKIILGKSKMSRGKKFDHFGQQFILA